MTDHVLIALLSLPAWHGDRALTHDERATMLRPVAEAIASVARTPAEMSWLAAQGWHESAYASTILRGECAPHQCDPDRDGKPRAVGPFQVWARFCTGADALAGQARCALRMARLGRYRCGTWIGAFAAQRGAGQCVAPRSAARVQTMIRVSRKLARAQWEASR